MKKKTLISIIVLVVLVLIAYLGYQTINGKNSSTTNNSDTSGKKVLRIATTGVSFPGSYKEDGKLTGFDVEVARAVAKKIGYKAEFTTTSFDGLFGLLTSGKVDAVASSIAITGERKKTYGFSTPYATFQYGVVVKTDSSLNNINELGGKTLAATVGSNQIKVIEKFDSSIKIQTFDDREAALTGVVNGKVEGYSNSKTILSAIIKQKGLDLKILKGDLGEENIAIAFTKGENQALVKKVNKALKELRKDGTISKLSKKYFSGIDATYKEK